MSTTSPDSPPRLRDRGGRPRRWRRVHALTALVLLAGLAGVGATAAATRTSHLENEQRLLDERVEAAASVLTAALPSIAATLAGAAEVAEATDADRAPFERLMAPLVAPDAQFRGAAILPAGEPDPAPIVVVGEAPQLGDLGESDTSVFLDRVTGTPTVSVVGLFDVAVPALGFAFSSPGPDPGFIVYAESPLPEDRTSVPQEDSAFDELDYALYLGDRADPARLLAASSIPLGSPSSATTVDFGDAELHLVMQPKGELTGALSRQLPWWVLVVGSALTLVFASSTERLQRRRDTALLHTAEIEQLYEEQRSVGQLVQRRLLPASIPAVEGLEVAVRYEPGIEGTAAGGDWYDVVVLDEHRVLVVVGDVAGRGLEAATTMAMLRHAIRAYAVEGVEPAAMVPKLTRLMGLEGETFATAVFLEIDRRNDTVGIVNAGHPKPLLVTGSDRRFLDTPVGPPVGVTTAHEHPRGTATAAPGATLLAFTDGLFERRGESVDVGMERLRAAVRADLPLDDVLIGLVEDLGDGAEPDDIAIVGVRWPAS